MQRWIPKGLAGKPVFVFETGGTTGTPKTRVGLEDFPDRLRDLQRDAARRAFSRGANWLMLGPSGPAAAAAVGRAPGAVSRRRHLLLRRSRSALGHQVDQEGLDRAPAGLQGSRHRSGGHDPPGGPRHPVHVRDAEAARIAGAAARVDGHDHPEGRHHGHFLGRHRVHAAVEPLRARGAARRRLHDADLRQHADGAGGERAERAAQQLQDRVLRAAAARGRSRSSISTMRTRWSTTARPAA